VTAVTSDAHRELYRCETGDGIGLGELSDLVGVEDNDTAPFFSFPDTLLVGLLDLFALRTFPFTINTVTADPDLTAVQRLVLIGFLLWPRVVETRVGSLASLLQRS